MFIIECLPISKTMKSGSLSYFSKVEASIGSLINVPLRGKTARAIVVACKEAKEEKALIKSADFSMRKINSIESKQFLGIEFMKAIKETAEYFATTEGALLYQLVPSLVLENTKIFIKKTNNNESGEKEIENIKAKAKSDVRTVQAEDSERISIYKSIIREEFAKKKSIFICLPHHGEMKYLKEQLERGIESYIVSFHNDQTEKELVAEMQKSKDESHPFVILGTAQWLSIGRSDFGTIIIERENDNGWHNIARPHIDMRVFAEIFSKHTDARCIIGDSMLRVETLWRYKQSEISEFETIRWKWQIPLKYSAIDMKKESEYNKEKGKEFRVIGKELEYAIKNSLEKSGNVFLYNTRRGLAPTTICLDCGESVSCSNCSSPMMLYKKGESGIFRCHQCGEVREAMEVCRRCGGWRLVPLGIGTDKVIQELQKLFPETEIFEINKDATKTGARALKQAEKFYTSKGSILIGTAMAIYYLKKKVDTVAIVSIDSLFSIPDFRIKEKIFSLLLNTRQLARENFLVQYRSLDKKLIDTVFSGDLVEFYRNEIRDREMLEYPPISKFIKITRRGKKKDVEESIKELREIFEDWDITVFPSLHEKRGEEAAINGVMKLERQSWPNRELREILLSLSPQYEIKVDPENLL